MQIELNGRCYRRLKPAHDSYPGLWQMLYNGNWHKVVNYQIRSDLNKKVNEEKIQNNNKKSLE